MSIRKYQALRGVKKWSLSRQEYIKWAAVGPIDGSLTPLHDYFKVFCIFPLDYVPYKWIIRPHSPQEF